MWFIGVEIEQETSASAPKKNPGSAPGSKTDPMLRAEYIFKILNIRGKLIPLRITSLFVSPWIHTYGWESRSKGTRGEGWVGRYDVNCR